MDLEEKWYGIPRELMYRCYAIGLLIALLSRSSMREMLQAPTMSIQVDIENIQEGGREPDEAVGSSQSSSIGGKSSLFSRLTGLVPRDVNKVSAPSEVVRWRKFSVWAPMTLRFIDHLILYNNLLSQMQSFPVELCSLLRPKILIWSSDLRTLEREQRERIVSTRLFDL